MGPNLKLSSKKRGNFGKERKKEKMSLTSDEETSSGLRTTPRRLGEGSHQQGTPVPLVQPSSIWKHLTRPAGVSESDDRRGGVSDRVPPLSWSDGDNGGDEVRKPELKLRWTEEPSHRCGQCPSHGREMNGLHQDPRNQPGRSARNAHETQAPAGWWQLRPDSSLFGCSGAAASDVHTH